MKSEDPPLVIGRIEYVALPEWGIEGIRAKVDTGARSSALHVENIEAASAQTVSFEVVWGRRGHERRKRVEARVLREGAVRSSTGESTHRIFVAAVVRLGPVEREIEISLIDRGQMIHRMLLGRTAIADGILIDVNRSLLLGRSRATAGRRARP